MRLYGDINLPLNTKHPNDQFPPQSGSILIDQKGASLTILMVRCSVVHSRGSPADVQKESDGVVRYLGQYLRYTRVGVSVDAEPKMLTIAA